VDGTRRTRRLDDVLVCEEPLSLLMSGLLTWGQRLSNAEAAALARATMRVEAEILRHDADDLADGAPEPRSQSARRAAAVLVLLSRITGAIPFVRWRLAGAERR